MDEFKDITHETLADIRLMEERGAFRDYNALEEEDLRPLEIPFKDSLTSEELAELKKRAEETWPASVNGILKSFLRHLKARRMEGTRFLPALKKSLTPVFYSIIDHGRFHKEAQKFIDYQKEKIAFDKIGSSQEYMEMFFQPDVLRRLIYCPQINVDATDDWGMFGYEPGFILIRGLSYKGGRTINDARYLSGMSPNVGNRKTVDGSIEVLTLPHFDYFPRHKFDYNLFTPTRRPKFYSFLNNLFDTQNINTDISKN